MKTPFDPVWRLGRGRRQTIMRKRIGGGGIDRISTTLATSATMGSFTYNFDTSVPVGAFATGRPFVVSDRPFQITSITPASQQIATANAYTDIVTGSAVSIGTNYWANGCVLNPYIGDVSDGAVQGHDALIATAGHSSQKSCAVPYDHSLNIDPGATGSPISIGIGDTGSYVKCLRTSGKTESGADWRYFDEWGCLDVLAEAPYVGSVAPGVSDTDKTCFTHSGLRNVAALGSGFSLPAGMPDLATCVAGDYFSRGLQPFWIRSGEVRRRFMIVDTDLAGTGYSGGVSGWAVPWSEFMAAMLAEGPDADGTLSLELALEFGAQLHGLYRRGDDRQGGAGQNNGHWQFALLFGMFFKGVPGLVDDILEIQGNLKSQHYWTKTSQIGGASKYPGNHNVYKRPIFDTMVDFPRWVYSATSYDPTSETYLSTIQGDDYEDTAMFPSFLEMANVLAMRAGPGGKDGGEVFCRGTTIDPTNDYASPLAYFDMHETRRLGVTTIEPYDADHKTYYDARRSGTTVPRWTGPPWCFDPQVGLPTSTTFLNTAGSGSSRGFSWDYSTAGGATETVLEYQIQYSYDRKYWKNVTTQGATGSELGLPAGLVYIRMRRRSASGWGPYSTNLPWKSTTGSTDNTPRSTITVLAGTTSGTAAVTSPGIYIPEAPDWGGTSWVAATGSNFATARYFAVSKGDPGTNTTGTWTWTLYIDGSPIAAYTDQTNFDQRVYLETAWAGLDLYVAVTVNDGTPISVNTSTFTVPTASGTQALIYPSGIAGSLPRFFTQRWGSSSDLTFDDASGAVDNRPSWRTAVQASAAARFWSLDEALPIGYLDSVSEGEIRCQVAVNDSSGSTNQFNDIVFCASGDAAGANGYVFRYLSGSSQRGLRLHRYASGTGTQLTVNNLIAGGTGTQVLAPVEYSGYTNSLPSRPTNIRVEFRRVSTTLVIKAKVWWVSDDDESYPYPEPDWQLSYTDSSPHAAGRLGIGLISTAYQRSNFWMGIGVGNTEVAPYA